MAKRLRNQKNEEAVCEMFTLARETMSKSPYVSSGEIREKSKNRGTIMNQEKYDLSERKTNRVYCFDIDIQRVLWGFEIKEANYINFNRGLDYAPSQLERVGDAALIHYKYSNSFTEILKRKLGIKKGGSLEEIGLFVNLGHTRENPLLELIAKKLEQKYPKIQFTNFMTLFFRGQKEIDFFELCYRIEEGELFNRLDFSNPKTQAQIDMEINGILEAAHNFFKLQRKYKLQFDAYNVIEREIGRDSCDAENTESRKVNPDEDIIGNISKPFYMRTDLNARLYWFLEEILKEHGLDMNREYKLPLNIIRKAD